MSRPCQNLVANARKYFKMLVFCLEVLRLAALACNRSGRGYAGAWEALCYLDPSKTAKAPEGAF